jgi:signal transduction histidine kinase
MKNKELRNMIIISAAVTVLAAVLSWIFLGFWAGLAVFITGALLSVLFIVYTVNRYKKIEKLNDYLVRVLAENDTDEILDQEEGELSILKTNIYKTTSTLKYQKELLADDKKNLAAALADISHQLKTPLTSMMDMNDLVVDEQDEDKRTEFLQTQSSQLDRMNWLIQTLLKLSKLDAGTALLKNEDIKSSVLVSDALKPFEIQMELKDIAKNVTGPDIDITCDKNWTLEVMQNIIKNCIEHMNDGGVLSITSDDTQLYSRITIRDNGCGIPAEDLPHIFERFHSRKDKANPNGTGLGLPIALEIARRHEISLQCRNMENGGACISFSMAGTFINHITPRK